MPTDCIQYWSLDPEVTFLNHGSFGACPKDVMAHQSALRMRMERQPVQFFLRDLIDLQDKARHSISQFVGAKVENLAFVRNATEGVNGILRSLVLKPGDEVVVTNHGYPACRNIVDFVCERWDAKVVVADVPFVGATSALIRSTILDKISSRTRLVLLDHITSPTGLVLPIEQLVPEIKNQGILTLVDGAHGPGMIDLNLSALKPDWYVGNFHKWVCAPKGAAFIYASQEAQANVHPASISHGYGISNEAIGRSAFHLEYDWTGTQDVTPWLCVPMAIRFMENLMQGGWTEIRARNRKLALAGRRLLADSLGIDVPTDDDLIGHLAALPLPPADIDDVPSPLYGTRLQQRLLDEYRIEVPLVPWPSHPQRLVRISAALYNDLDDYRALAQALKEIFRC